MPLIKSGLIYTYQSPNRLHNQKHLYKYTKASIAKTVLATRKLRWSSPLKFNDPFDVTQELRLNFNTDELNNEINETLASLIESDELKSVRNSKVQELLDIFKHKNIQERIAVAKEMRESHLEPANVSQSASYEAILEKWRSLVPRFRILCLSEVFDSTSMWYHYGDQYRGLVMEFEALDGLESVFLAAKPVTYQEGPPTITSVEVWAQCMLGLTEFSIEDLFEEYEYVKNLDWAYEREWRLSTMAKPGDTGLSTDYEFNPQELSAVYFGPKCSKEDQREIHALLDYGLEHVESYNATLDNVAGKFKFVRCNP